jgi:hypothetical protein
MMPGSKGSNAATRRWGSPRATRGRLFADSRGARSTRSSRNRPGSNGQPPSPTAGWDSPLPGRRALSGFASSVDRPTVCCPLSAGPGRGPECRMARL